MTPASTSLSPAEQAALADLAPIRMPERKSLSFEDVEVLEEKGLYDLARIARKYLRPRRRWYRLWRLSDQQKALIAKLKESGV